MCDPAGEKQQGSGGAKICRLGIPGAERKIHADVIERHDDHDHAPQKVNGCDSLRLINRFRSIARHRLLSCPVEPV